MQKHRQAPWSPLHDSRPLPASPLPLPFLRLRPFLLSFLSPSFLPPVAPSLHTLRTFTSFHSVPSVTLPHCAPRSPLRPFERPPHPLGYPSPTLPPPTPRLTVTYHPVRTSARPSLHSLFPFALSALSPPPLSLPKPLHFPWVRTLWGGALADLGGGRF